MFLNFRHPATQVATALKSICLEQNINIISPLTPKEHLLIYIYICEYWTWRIKNNKITWNAAQDIFQYYEFALKEYSHKKDSLEQIPLEQIFFEFFSDPLYYGNYADYTALDMLEMWMIKRWYYHLLDSNKEKHRKIISKIFYI